MENHTTVEFLEACCRLDGGIPAWGDRVCAAAERLFDDSLGAVGFSYAAQAEEHVKTAHAIFGPRTQARFGAFVDVTGRQWGTTQSHWIGVFAARPAPFSVATSALSRRQRALIMRNAPTQVTDCLAMFGTLRERGFLLSTAYARLAAPVARRARAIAQLTAHVAVGYHLLHRRIDEDPLRTPGCDAVFSPAGKLVARGASRLPRTAVAELAHAVQSVDRVRCRRRKLNAEEALQAWRAVAAGRYALVERTERDGRRMVVAIAVDRTRAQPLTHRERTVAQHAARGLSNKAIAAELGIHTSTVGVHLLSVLRKLGMSDRRMLIAVGAAALSAVDHAESPRTR